MEPDPYSRPRVRIQLLGRIKKWVDSNPEYRTAVLEWLARFRRDPFDPSLDAFEHPDQHEQRVFDYSVPGAPLVVVMVIARYEDSNGVRWARVLFPRGTDDLVPDE